jgi:hypothetical protein
VSLWKEDYKSRMREWTESRWKEGK